MATPRVRGFWRNVRAEPADLSGETTMLITRRGAMLGSTATLLGAGFRAPGAGGERPNSDRLARVAHRAELGASDWLRPRCEIRRGRDQRRGGRERQKGRDHHARHAGRSHQGGQRRAGHDRSPEGQRDLGSDKLRRSACDQRRDGARENGRTFIRVSSTASSIRRNIRTHFASPRQTANGTTRCAIIARIF